MANVRSDKNPGIFAKNAQTTIPPSPTVGESFRDPVNGLDNIEEGWQFKQKVLSQEWNEIEFRRTTLLDLIDRTGILGWSNLVDYDVGFAAVFGSDNKIYELLLENGPNTAAGVKDPVLDPTFWKLLTVDLASRVLGDLGDVDDTGVLNGEVVVRTGAEYIPGHAGNIASGPGGIGVAGSILDELVELDTRITEAGEGVSVHNDLTDIQGGTIGERFHLTVDQLAKVDALPDPSEPPSGGSQLTFTQSGVYIPTTAGLKSILVEVTGTGGAGGGVDGIGGTTSAAAGGGGAGGYAKKVFQASELFLSGPSESITIGQKGLGVVGGNGGDGGFSSFSIGATLLTAFGGFGASFRFTSAGTAFSAGGPGGSGSSGSGTPDIVIQGGSGGTGQSDANNNSVLSGTGGSGFIGTGGQAQLTSNSNGVSAPDFNGGGSGATAVNTSANFKGGDGGGGLVVITEFF